MNSILKRTSLAITPGLFYSTTTAQDQSHAQGKGEASIGLSYYKKSDTGKIAVAIIKAKNKDGKFVPAKNEQVNFCAIHDNKRQLIKSVNTDYKG